MTISSTTNTVSYTGTGSATSFAVTYVFFGTGTDAEIEVVEVVIATGAETVKSNGSDFTVSGGSGATGTVTAAVAPASTVKWVINRTTTQTQETDYVENDPFPAESHEEALDRLTAVDQEQQRALERTAQLPDGYTGSFDPTLPTLITGSTVLAFNAGATAFEIGPTTAAISGAAAEAAAAAVSATESANSATASAASAATASAYAGTQTVDLFNGTGSQTAFTLSVAPANGDENNTDVHISGVYQQKDTYSLSGTTLTFSTAPPAATGNVEVMHMSSRAIETPADGSVTYPKFASGLVDTDLSSVSGSDDTIASAKSIKTYVDAQVTAADLDFAGGTGTGAVDLDSQTFTVAGTANEIETAASGQTITVGLPDNVTIAGVTTHGGNVVSDTDSTDSLGTTGVRWAGVWADAINGVTAPTAQYTSAEETKLAGIEASADVTDATNVASALANGVAALTSGEVSQLANIGTEAISAAEWGYVAASTQAYDSADHSKLDGIEASADVTDATNVTAAGALMDSELTAIASVKALNQGVATSDSPSFSALTLSGGNLLFSSAAKGVYLGVTSATAANLLDDYEEGDWTPTIGSAATVSPDATYNTGFTAGKYTKVGRVVHCSATLRLTDKGTQTGNITILGLPFASANNVGFRTTWSSWFHGSTDMDLTGNTTGTIMMYQAHNTSYISVRVKDPATTAAENVAFPDISDTMYLQISGSYVAA